MCYCIVRVRGWEASEHFSCIKSARSFPHKPVPQLLLMFYCPLSLSLSLSLSPRPPYLFLPSCSYRLIGKYLLSLFPENLILNGISRPYSYCGLTSTSVEFVLKWTRWVISYSNKNYHNCHRMSLALFPPVFPYEIWCQHIVLHRAFIGTCYSISYFKIAASFVYYSRWTISRPNLCCIFFGHDSLFLNTECYRPCVCTEISKVCETVLAIDIYISVPVGPPVFEDDFSLFSLLSYLAGWCLGAWNV